MCSLLYKHKKKGVLFLSCILAILVWHSKERLNTFNKVKRERLDILHEENGNIIPKNTPPMVDFVVRSAYIDTRERNGYKNSTVIFAETSKDVLKFGLVVGCGVDTIDAKEYKVESLYFNWIWYHMGHLTHEDIMITCYDLEGSTIASVDFVRFFLSLT